MKQTKEKELKRPNLKCLKSGVANVYLPLKSDSNFLLY